MRLIVSHHTICRVSHVLTAGIAFRGDDDDGVWGGHVNVTGQHPAYVPRGNARVTTQKGGGDGADLTVLD